jgi:hypothetical protein
MMGNRILAIAVFSVTVSSAATGNSTVAFFTREVYRTVAYSCAS